MRALLLQEEPDHLRRELRAEADLVPAGLHEAVHLRGQLAAGLAQEDVRGLQHGRVDGAVPA